MSPHIARKKTAVWSSSPAGVAAPMGWATWKSPPKIVWVNLYVSGLATMKKTSAEIKEYLAFNQALTIVLLLGKDSWWRSQWNNRTDGTNFTNVVKFTESLTETNRVNADCSDCAT